MRVILITYCSTQNQIKIAHSLIPIETVRTELLSLNESLIRYVAQKLQRVGSNVSNMVGYIRTMLWNARTEAEITGQPIWSSSSWGYLPAWYLRDDDHILAGEEGGAW